MLRVCGFLHGWRIHCFSCMRLLSPGPAAKLRGIHKERCMRHPCNSAKKSHAPGGAKHLCNCPQAARPNTTTAILYCAASKGTSFPRKRESIWPRWTPACAGVTTAMTFISMRLWKPGRNLWETYYVNRETRPKILSDAPVQNLLAFPAPRRALRGAAAPSAEAEPLDWHCLEVTEPVPFAV